jgi:SNF2 family DNA or RNA helicase
LGSDVAVSCCEVVDTVSDPVDLTTESDSEPSGSHTSVPPSGGRTTRLGSLGSEGRPLGGTLIVCPMTLMGQWVAEIRSKVHSGVDIDVLMYYGQNRHLEARHLTRAHVVVTSYGVLVSEMKRRLRTVDGAVDALADDSVSGSSSSKARLLFQPQLGVDVLSISWRRVVLDEAHTIKNALTEVAKACCMVRKISSFILY